jgi:transaldolase
MMNSLHHLNAQGQSVWYDNINNDQLVSGQFQSMLNANEIAGVTTNPTLFEKAITGGHAYDELLSRYSYEANSPKALYDALVIQDIRLVADILRPVYDRTNGRDGYVSFQISPDLTYDTDGIVQEFRRIWHLIDRPNLMGKIVTTNEGIQAAHQVLIDGMNVNFTLLFSLENYRKVATTYLNALDTRSRQGKDVSSVASVASFFVSRIDTLMNSMLDARIRTTDNTVKQRKLQSLQGKMAIANSRLAYQEFKQIFDGPQYTNLTRYNAPIQRLLWASTSTFPHNEHALFYAEGLIGPNTVHTMSPETLTRFRNHGKVHYSIEDNVVEAKMVLAELEACGFSYDAITKFLQDEGIQQFIDAHHRILKWLQDKQATHTNIPGNKLLASIY